MKVVITGAAGFLGRKLAGAILDRGRLTGADGTEQEVDQLVLFDHVEPVSPRPGDNRVSLHKGDIADRGLVADLVGPDTQSLFHLASVVSAGAEEDFDLGYRTNLDGMLAVLEAGRACPAIDLMADPRPAIRLIRVEGTEGWYLFADARLPLAEAQAERIAALEDAVSALQEALAAPATVRGGARYRPNYVAALIDAPIGGLTILALDAAGNEAGRTVTEPNGAYEMKLPPGVYRLTTLSGPNSPQHFGVVLEPGDQRRLDFIFLQPPQEIR